MRPYEARAAFENDESQLWVSFGERIPVGNLPFFLFLETDEEVSAGPASIDGPFSPIASFLSSLTRLTRLLSFPFSISDRSANCSRVLLVE